MAKGLALITVAVLLATSPHYWQVYFDTNRAIREAFGEAGFPAAEQPIVVRTDGHRAGGARQPVA